MATNDKAWKAMIEMLIENHRIAINVLFDNMEKLTDENEQLLEIIRGLISDQQEPAEKSLIDETPEWFDEMIATFFTPAKGGDLYD